MVKAIAHIFMDGHNSGSNPPTVISFQEDGIWYVTESGPSYINHWHVVDYDDRGLTWLRSHERKEVQSESK